MTLPDAPHSGRFHAEASSLPRDHYEAIVQSSDDAILSKDSRGVIREWNPAATRIYGYSREEAIGQPISILIPPHRAGEEREILDQIFSGERVDHYETERLTKDGRLIVISLTVSPIRDESGDVVRASVIARDITALTRSRELAERLQEVTAALSREMTPRRTVGVLLEQVSATLGAVAGAVGLLDDAGETIELVGSVGHSREGIEPWGRFSIESEVPMSVAIRSAESIWTQSADELRVRFPGLGDAQLRLGSLAVIPLAVGGRPFGAVSLSFEKRREFDAEEKAFLVAASQQAAHALDRAHLYDAQRRAAERLAFLAEAGELLAEPLDPGETMARIADLAIGRIADWCGVVLLDENGELRNVAVAHVDPKQVEIAKQLRARYPVDPDDETGVPNVIRTGAAELYREVSDQMLVDAARDDVHLMLLRALGLASVMIVPLQARGRTHGAVTFVSSDPARLFDEGDLELAEDLARRAALAIDTATLFRREHQAALTLQRSLLPQSLPEVEGVSFAAHYDPAGLGLEVGGDWYEVVAQDDGTVALTIGDVAGRGIRAAAVMGRLRMALRAYVLDGQPPAEAVKRLDRLTKDAETPEMITLFHLRFDPDRAIIEYVRAGHPPALLRLPDGRVSELAGGGTPPLGILDGLDYRQHTVEVPHGSRLLLYTDGLIERPGEDLDAGLQRLRRLFADAPEQPDECVQYLRREFGTDAVRDDVAILVMTTTPG